jgi:uncharacterized protein with PQ loop repeat
MKQQELTKQTISETKNKKTKNVVTTFFVIGALGLLLCAISWPLATIWGLNQLFRLSIEYTFFNWLAAWVLILTFQGAINVSNSRSKKN